jgi:uncharacterized protein (TIGR02246 family)
MQLNGRYGRALAAATALTAVGAVGFVLLRAAGPATDGEQIGQAPTPSQQGNTDDEKAIRANATAYAKAFNAGDARAVAALWAPQGEYVEISGQCFQGRGAIEKELASYFAENKALKIEITPDSLRFVGLGIALESGHVKVTRVADGAVNTCGYSIVHSKLDGRWLLASVRETQQQTPSNYERLKELEWLVGKWSAKGRGRVIELSCAWTHGRNFLIRSYTLKRPDGSIQTGTHIIGWDPLANGIHGWLFDSEGGMGSETWTRDGERWIVEARGVMRDGRQTEAANVLTRIDGDSFTWQSAGRSIDGIRLPDTAAIKVSRVKTNR